MLPAPPRVVDRYLVYDAIAAGGMATVHIGRLLGPEGFARTVAVKQLHPQFARDPEFVAMFLDEARLAARVRHPNVVSPLDVVALEAELFIVMDFVQGESLSQLRKLTKKTPVPPSIASSIVLQMLLGLHAAHEATNERGEPLNIVHRDVSPQNVLVGVDGQARVVDFGIAKAATRLQTTDDGKLKGKLGYMAPEQLRLEPQDRRADIFTSGIVLWELLTGRRLFPPVAPGAAVERILNYVPEGPSKLVPELSAALDEVVTRALRSDRDERFQTARCMAEALERAVPPEGALGVAAWLESICGSTLRARAQRVAEIESVSLGDRTRHSVAGASLASTLPAPQARGEAREGELPDSTDLSLVPPSTESAAPSRSDRSRRPGGRPLVFWSLIAAAAIALACLAFMFGDHLQRLRGGRAAPALAERTLVTDAPQLVAQSVAPARAMVDRTPAPDTGVRKEVTPSREDGERQAFLPRPRETSRKSRSAAQPDLPASTGSAREPKATAPAGCDIPYSIDKKGVKRFRLECF